MDEKPFWLNPPYVILFDLIRLYKVKPWEVNLKQILMEFMREMRSRGFIDFSASGTALLSSSIIHRLKSEALLKMEQPPRRAPPRPEESVPPPLPMPLRFEYTSTSIEDIIEALISALDMEAKAFKPGKALTSAAYMEPSMDEFFLNIESKVEELYGILVEMALRYGPAVSFIQLCRNLTMLEVVRRFILLLFLAQGGKITLQQREGGKDIEILIHEAIPGERAE
ncbi:MAG: hypothetical protein QXO32_08495 [Candidatus Bathyarchaeia archaeon]